MASTITCRVALTVPVALLLLTSIVLHYKLYHAMQFNKNPETPVVISVQQGVYQHITIPTEQVTPSPSSQLAPPPQVIPDPNKPPELNMNLHWMAPFFTSSGYGSEAIEFVLALDSRLPGHLSIRQFGDGETKGYKKGLPAKTQAVLQRLATKRLVKVVSVCHSVPDSWYPAKARSARCPVAHSVYSVGRTMFETDKIPAAWVEKCNTLDEIWVPTEFHKETFEASGVKKEKLVVVPESVDVEYFNPENYEPMALKDAEYSDYKFLSIFKWEDRKGWRDLFRAYLTEFNNTERVALYVLTHKFGQNDPEEQYNRFLGDEKFNISTTLPLVRIINQDLAAHLLPSLYKAVDAFVIPSRGEGWGRPHVEAMAMELPVIATNWSGPTAFMSYQNSFPLEIDGLEPSTLVEDHKWAKPSHTHLRKLLRYVYTYPREAKQRGLQARRDMVEYFSPKAVADLVVQELLRIQKKIEERAKG